MRKLSLLSASVFSLFLASCGGGIDASGGTDTDSDGIFDSKDSCRNSPTGFISTPETDYDGDGCKDNSKEDLDDDNDRVTDDTDKCDKGTLGFISTPETDYDGDGCKDNSKEDLDDDNDGVYDVNAEGHKLDKCPKGSLFKSISTSTDPNVTITDYDGDGCKDDDIEDNDDDNDEVNDVDGDGNIVDLCRKSANKKFVSNDTTDRDRDGCEDANDEDQDDGSGKDEDNDGKFGTDPNNSTIELDKCENGDKGWTSQPSTDEDDDGCQDDGEDVDKDNDGLIEINDALELNNIRYDLAGTSYDDNTGEPSSTGCPSAGCSGYELANDITFEDPNIIPSNWDPIGDDSNPFTATLEGNDNTIRNLVIVNSTQTDSGFFIKLDGTVQNLSFEEGSVTNTYTDDISDSTTGVLASYNSRTGTIYNVSIGLSISAADRRNIVGSSVASNIGSLVASNRGTIRDSSATGNVVGSAGNNDRVGGLVGVNYVAGTIRNSYAAGNVYGRDGNDFVGGLVGSSYGTIGNSYATGNVYGEGGNDQVGGLLGSGDGAIRNSYATGNVDGGTGDDSVGGLLGYADNKYAYVTLSNSYSLGNVDGGDGSDTVGRLLGKKGTGPETIAITNNYYNSGSTLTVSGEDTELTLVAAEAKDKTSPDLKTLTANTTEADFGANNRWNVFNWDFGSTSQYPSLRSYEKNSSGNQIKGGLLCNQPTDFVQCSTN